MKFLKSHFALSRSQQNGIFVLVLLIIGFQIFLFLEASSEPEKIDQGEIQAYQKQLDSINKIAAPAKDTIYPFNPNYITDFKGYQLGMKTEEIDRLLAYRQTGKWINSVEDFQKVTGVSDSLLNSLSTSFRFPEWTQKRTSGKIQNAVTSASEIRSITDLNSASVEDLKLINGVGDVLSQRIIKYKNSIGGFLSEIQLKDVYGLSPEVIERIHKRFQVLSKPNIAIKNLNLIAEADLAEIPYFNYSIAKEIISYRKLHERIASFEELSKIKGFPYDKIDRIKLYLTLE